jgi:6-phosphogluconate dehydrogenase
MQLGMIGLGRMGANMAERLLSGGHGVIGFDRDPEAIRRVADKGASAVRSPADLIERLSPPRVIWLMVPAGEAVDEILHELAPRLERGDILIDGGNSNYRDSVRRARSLEERGIRFADVGTSGGVWGLAEGYCLMVGSSQEVFGLLEPVLKTLAIEGGYARVGPSGAGHFAKMVHNGIEYGMLQAYGEGFELLRKSDFDFDLAGIARLWNRGSVVRSWLLELAEAAFARDPKLSSIRGYVEDSGEGRWAVIDAVERGVPAPVLSLSLFVRFLSRQDDSFAAKVVAALRREFGGHAVKKE